MHFSSPLNKDLTVDFNTKYPNKTSEKFGMDVNSIANSNAKVELTFIFKPKQQNISQREAEIHGSIHIGSRAFGYKGQGSFEPFVTPDKKEILYVGSISGELLGVKMSSKEPNYKDYSGENAQWFTVFNPNTKQLHITAGVGFQEHTGMLVFGENMMDQEKWEAFENQLEQRYPTPTYKVGE